MMNDFDVVKLALIFAGSACAIMGAAAGDPLFFAGGMMVAAATFLLW